MFFKKDSYKCSTKLLNIDKIINYEINNTKKLNLFFIE